MAEEYADALDLYLEALRIAEQNNDKTTASSCTGNIGLIFTLVRDYERGAYYTRKTLEMAAENNEEDKRRRAACILTELYINLSKIDSAEYYNRMQKSIKGVNNADNNYMSFYNDGLIAEATGKETLAMYYYNKALEYATAHCLPLKYIIQQLMEMGKLHLETNDVEEARRCFLKAGHMADSIGSMNMLAIVWSKMEEVSNACNDTAAAKLYRSKYMDINDSLIDRTRFNAAKNKLYEYEEQKNRKRISGLTHTIDNYVMAIIGVLIPFFMAMAIIFIIVRNNRRLHKMQRILIDKNSELVQQYERNTRLRDGYLDAMQQIGDNPERMRYHAGIPERHVEAMVKSVTDVMEDVDTISNPHFNLSMLVSLVNSNSTYVSWIINETFGKNFKTLLNEYRIKEAAKRLCDRENYGNMTIQSIYESVGYNSASNFIKAFKTIMGMTPSEFQKLQDESLHGKRAINREQTV